jgi:NAD(P)-dependent dehydrogenase (short-subunit alcohol dehydrogenase family)
MDPLAPDPRPGLKGIGRLGTSIEAAEGKTILITGGTTGIGRAAALALARRGANISIVGRNRVKGHQVVEQMTAAGAGQHRYWPADLSTMGEVRNLARRVREESDRLDVLVNNAGGMFFRRHTTADGLERTFALNHLAPFLLTHLLLPVLESAGDARIVTTSSAAHWSGQIDFEDLQLRRGYTILKAYSRTKLANILFTRELARRLDRTGISATCFHPGLVATNLAKQNLVLRPFVSLFYALFARSAEDGADTLVHLAIDSAVEGRSGGYYVNRQLAGSSSASQDARLAAKLWLVSEELVQLTPQERLLDLGDPQVA